jgi:acetolactate synthase I/II/III large subunit
MVCLPAAIGAAGADPTKQVICVSGDGSFQMNLQEIITAVTYQLPIKIAIMNNGYLGMVRQWQEMFHQRRYSAVKITSPNFAKLAEAYGAVGFKASTKEEARQIIKTSFDQPGPVIMEFDVLRKKTYSQSFHPTRVMIKSFYPANVSKNQQLMEFSHQLF